VRRLPQVGPEEWSVTGLGLTWVAGTVLLLLICSGAGLYDERNTYLDLVAAFATFAPPLAWIAGQLRRRGLEWSVLLGPCPAERPWLRWLGLVAGLIALSVSAVWALWWPLSFVWPGVVESWVLDDDTRLLVGDTALARGAHAAILALLIAVAGPILEELIFRGVLLRRWTRCWGATRAVVASSLLFGLLHVDILGSVYFGFALCMLAMKGGGVRVPIVIHMLNNASAVTMGLIVEAFELGGEEWTLEQFREQVWWALPLFVVAAAWAVWWGRRAVRGMRTAA
jgi:uncharacterized protein